MKEPSHEIQKPRGSPNLLVGMPKRAQGNPKCIPESPGKLRSSGITQERQVMLRPSGCWPKGRNMQDTRQIEPYCYLFFKCDYHKNGSGNYGNEQRTTLTRNIRRN